MNEIDRLSRHASNHEPSPAVKPLFLGVPHQAYRVGASRFPGLFGVTGLERATRFLAIALVLELLGFGAMRYFANASLVLLGLGFVFDVALGYVAHLPVAKIVLHENRSLAAPALDEQELEDRRVQGYKVLRAGLVVLIYAFAGFKAWLLLLAYGQPDLLSLSLMAGYVLTALIHQHFTGYAIAGWGLRRALDREHAKYLENRKGTALRFAGPRSVAHEIGGVVPTRSMRHELSPTHLVTYGLLLDRDVQALVGVQPKEVKEAVGLVCLAAQLRILEEEPVPEGTAPVGGLPSTPPSATREVEDDREPSTLRRGGALGAPSASSVASA